MSFTNKKSLSVSQERERNLMEWVGYWRKNPQKFAKDYIGINLFWYQKFLIYMMDKVSIFMYIASRGQGAVSA